MEEPGKLGVTGIIETPIVDKLFIGTKRIKTCEFYKNMVDFAKNFLLPMKKSSTHANKKIIQSD